MTEMNNAFNEYITILKNNMDDVDIEYEKNKFIELWNDEITKYYIYESDSDPVWSYTPLDNEDGEGYVFSELPVLAIYDIMRYPPTSRK